MSHSFGDTLNQALTDQAHEEMIRLNQLREQQIKDSATDHFTSKLYECVASHYENGDRKGADAIVNAIGYAQQS